MGEYPHEGGGGDSLAASFMASVKECISERECKLDGEELNVMYRTFSTKVGFKKYLHGVSAAGSRLYLSSGHGPMG